MNSGAPLNRQSDPYPVNTVCGSLPYDRLGITDAHNHLWIEAVPGADPGSPVLAQFDPILQDLIEYRERGGGTILDCQPPGCGRDGNQLLALSQASGINLIACTGFHRRKYYAEGHWVWQASAQQIADFLSSELQQGLVETRQNGEEVRAGFIKIALESTWAACPAPGLEGAAAAAQSSGALIEIHTEKGALAEKACIYFTDAGLLPRQLVLCHMDKRDDLGLHKDLARFGVLLEYDTFFRPKYDPAAHVWPLLERMVAAGLSDHIALATDMAEAEYYHHLGGGPGLAGLPGSIQDQLVERGIPQADRNKLLGGNIARRLAGID
jgi:predicted metal-dependent phosphotriesterase family hydrolase